jgi:hypothetical protein
MPEQQSTASEPVTVRLKKAAEGKIPATAELDEAVGCPEAQDAKNAHAPIIPQEDLQTGA